MEYNGFFYSWETYFLQEHCAMCIDIWTFLFGFPVVNLRLRLEHLVCQIAIFKISVWDRVFSEFVRQVSVLSRLLSLITTRQKDCLSLLTIGTTPGQWSASGLIRRPLCLSGWQDNEFSIYECNNHCHVWNMEVWNQLIIYTRQCKCFLEGADRGLIKIPLY